MDTETHLTPAQKMAAYRKRMKAKGLKQIQIWVPDTRSPEFIKDLQRQSRLLAQDPHDREMLDWLEQIADIGDGWEE